ncbi:aberrant root formation protein 4-like isoform X1 [Apium graveolens]|uniref:aberrant root formation protein 4-like isoform X1 n=1 Tax=Apium graveolens TaxID=4045 RepID=UPI003D7BB3A0
MSITPENLNTPSAIHLRQILASFSSSAIDVMDALSFELPKVVARFSSGSKRCIDVCESIIDRFIATCSPRDMLSVLCEALDCEVAMCNSCWYYAIVFSELTKGISCLLVESTNI